MTVKHIFVYSIIASLCVFVHVQADNLTVEKYLGQWYEIAATDHGDPVTVCDRFNVTKSDHGNGRFNEVYKAGRVENKLQMIIRGKFENSTMSIRFPTFKASILMEYTYESFNGGRELIFIEKDKQCDIQLISRETSASTEAKERFRYLVAAQGQKFIEIDHSECPHDDN